MFYFCSLAPGNGASKHQNPGPGNRNKTFKNVIEMIARLPAPPAPLPPYTVVHSCGCRMQCAEPTGMHFRSEQRHGLRYHAAIATK